MLCQICFYAGFLEIKFTHRKVNEKNELKQLCFQNIRMKFP